MSKRHDTLLIARRIPVPRRAPETVEEQLGLLFGEELFGVWESPAPSAEIGAGLQFSRMRAQRRWRRLVLLMLLSLAAAPLIVVARLGIERRASSAIEAHIGELAHLLETGSLEQAAPLVGRLSMLIETAGSRVTPDQKRLVLRADATLYRYYDASPERRARVTRELPAASAGDGFDVVVARAMLMSLADRKQLLAELERVAKERAEDPAAIALIGGVHAKAGAHEAALRAYRSAESIQPLHVAHLAELALAELRGDQASRAETVLETMIDVAPKSGWTALAREAIARAAGEEEPAAPPKPELIPPVARAEIFIGRAIAARSRGDDVRAKELLTSALEIVNLEDPFMSDWVDRLAGARR